MIRVNCKNNGGFRRAGMFHPEGVKEYPDGTFNEAQLALLKAEPLLAVDEIPDEPKDTEINPEDLTKEQLAADLALFDAFSGDVKKAKKDTLVILWTETRDALQALAGK